MCILKMILESCSSPLVSACVVPTRSDYSFIWYEAGELPIDKGCCWMEMEEGWVEGAGGHYNMAGLCKLDSKEMCWKNKFLKRY